MTHRRVCPNKCQHQSLYSWLDLATGFTQLRDSQAGFHQEFRANHEVVPWWLRIWLFGTVGRPTIWTLIELRWAYPSTDHLYSMSTIYNRWWSLIIRHTAPPRDSQLDHPEGVEINGRPDFGGSGENSMLMQLVLQLCSVLMQVVINGLCQALGHNVYHKRTESNASSNI